MWRLSIGGEVGLRIVVEKTYQGRGTAREKGARRKADKHSHSPLLHPSSLSGKHCTLFLHLHLFACSIFFLLFPHPTIEYVHLAQLLLFFDRGGEKGIGTGLLCSTVLTPTSCMVYFSFEWSDIHMISCIP